MPRNQIKKHVLKGTSANPNKAKMRAWTTTVAFQSQSRTTSTVPLIMCKRSKLFAASRVAISYCGVPEMFSVTHFLHDINSIRGTWLGLATKLFWVEQSFVEPPLPEDGRKGQIVCVKGVVWNLLFGWTEYSYNVQMHLGPPSRFQAEPSNLPQLHLLTVSKTAWCTLIDMGAEWMVIYYRLPYLPKPQTTLNLRRLFEVKQFFLK